MLIFPYTKGLICKGYLFLIFIILFESNILFTQNKTQNPLLKWTSWTILQALPSVTFYEDKNSTNTSIRTGFQWQVIPLSFSFRVNKYLKHFNFFYIQPVKRFSGSAELFFQPEYIFGGFKNAAISRFMFKSGVRTVLPVAQKGEYLSFSFGLGLNYQKLLTGGTTNTTTLEAGVYSFFGMLGLKFNYNPGAINRYSFGMYLKYY